MPPVTPPFQDRKKKRDATPCGEKEMASETGRGGEGTAERSGARTSSRAEAKRT